MGKQNEHESKEKAQVTEPVLWVKDYFYTVLEGGGGGRREGVTSMAPHLDSRMTKLPEDSSYDFHKHKLEKSGALVW